MKKVALLVETSHGYGRRFLMGVAKYSRLHEPWSFYITPKDFHQKFPKMRDWGGDGIIARAEDRTIVRRVVESGLPSIILDPPETCDIPTWAARRIIRVSPDPGKIIRMAIDHFLNQGFRRFAFCGVPGRAWSDTRQKNFILYLREQGYPYSIYKPERRKDLLNWETEGPILSEWLRRLPKPVAIMACNDVRGRQVLEACGGVGVTVPQEAAVLGVDDDEVFCELCNPSLSSVVLNVSRAGFELAGRLDRMMQGNDLEEDDFYAVEPLYVAERQSTDVLVVEDPIVAEALAFIRGAALKLMGVSDVANKVAVSRRALEIRFRRAVGWSVHDEIQRIRLNHVRQLLVETELPIEKISELSGFAAASYMSATFRKHWGMTPLAYRQKNRM